MRVEVKLTSPAVSAEQVLDLAGERDASGGEHDEVVPARVGRGPVERCAGAAVVQGVGLMFWFI